MEKMQTKDGHIDLTKLKEYKLMKKNIWNPIAKMASSIKDKSSLIEKKSGEE